MNNISELLNELSELHIFRNLKREEILDILKISEIRKYESEQIIFSESQEDDRSMFVIIKGRVEIVSESAVTKEKVAIFAASKGLTFGEMSFLDDQPRSATIKTVEPTEVFLIKRNYFDQLLEHKPEVAARFLLGLSNILSRRLRATDQKLKYSL